MSDQIKIPCMFMRGGTSRGPYFLKTDLPEDITERDKILLAVMGSPDVRQIDGLGGAEPVKSKVAIIDKGQLLAVGTIQEIQASTGVNNLEDAFIRLIGD